MLIMPSFKKSLIVEQFQGNNLKVIYYRLNHGADHPLLMMKLSSTYTQYFIFTFLMFYETLKIWKFPYKSRNLIHKVSKITWPSIKQQLRKTRLVEGL